MIDRLRPALYMLAGAQRSTGPADASQAHKESAMPHRIVFTGPGRVEYQAFEPASPGPGQVLVRARYTLMSPGTEGLLLSRQTEPGTHWHQWLASGAPVYPGYCCVAEVVALGTEVRSVRPGQMVAVRGGHASHQVWDETECYPVPEGFDLRLVPWWSLAKIAAQGARDAAYRLGDRVLIIGAGPIGQMSLRWAFACGCAQVIVCDPMELRLDLARRGGACATLARPITDCLVERDVGYGLVGRVWDGPAPRVVVDTTGNAQVFTAALMAVAEGGTVVMLGDTGAPSGQRLASELLLRNLHIVGSHDKHVDATWNHRTVCELFFTLVGDGRMRLDGLNTHTFAPSAAAEAYAFATIRRGESLGILFDWSAVE